MLREPEQTAPELKLAGPQLLDAGTKRAIPLGALALLAGVAAYGFAGASIPSNGDRVSASQSVALSDGFSRARGMLVPIMAEQQREEVMAALKLSPERFGRLMSMVETGERAVGWLTLWDNFDEDGDVVSVSAAGLTQIVPLTHAPKRIAVAYVPGQPVYVTGEHDGGGGITVAVELSTGSLPLPPIAVGQTVTLPLL